jgi:hypothetical protein
MKTWLINFLESKFKSKQLKDLDWTNIYCDRRAGHRWITYENGFYKKTVTFKAHLYSKEDNEIIRIGYWINKYGDKSENDYAIENNPINETILYIAKKILSYF